MKQTFDAGDFVVVDGRMGVVCHGRKRIQIVKRKKPTLEIEVWFGETGQGDFAITYYVPTTKCVNIRLARIVKPFLAINQACNQAAANKGLS